MLTAYDQYTWQGDRKIICNLIIINQSRAKVLPKMADKQALKPKKQRWYLGGFAGAGAVLFTHPLDLLKVGIGLQQYSILNIYSILGATGFLARLQTQSMATSPHPPKIFF